MPVYQYPKEGKIPKPDNLPEELSNFSPEACSCTSKCSLYHEKRFAQKWSGSKIKEESQQKATNPTPHDAPQQHYEYSPAVVAEAMVFVAKIGATVAAATGVPVLKMVFYGKKFLKLENYYI